MEIEIYYRIIIDKKTKKLNVVCMQWFDEFDYDQNLFLKDCNGDIMKFDSEEEALDYVKQIDFIRQIFYYNRII